MKANGLVDLQPILHDMNSVPIMVEANKSASFGQEALRNFYGERSGLSFVPIEGLDATLPIVAQPRLLLQAHGRVQAAKLDPELEFQIVALADAEVGGVTH